MPYTEEQVLATLPGVRPILEQIANKWSILILTFLCEQPKRFNALKRRLDGITQKALTESLRRLERNGLVARRVIPVSPVAVEYSITPLGRELKAPFLALYDWAVTHQREIEKAQRSFDSVVKLSTPRERKLPRSQ
jgi:DNA-binding HxlR family transcriptional regulator